MSEENGDQQNVSDDCLGDQKRGLVAWQNMLYQMSNMSREVSQLRSDMNRLDKKYSHLEKEQQETRENVTLIKEAVDSIIGAVKQFEQVDLRAFIDRAMPVIENLEPLSRKIKPIKARYELAKTVVFYVVIAGILLGGLDKAVGIIGPIIKAVL